MKAIRTGDILSGAALAGLGIYVVFEARGWEYLGPDGPGPGFFPLWYGLGMLAFSVLLIATSLTGAARTAGARVNWREIRSALTAWAGLAACVGLLKVLGFLLAFALFTFFLVAVLYRRPILSAIVFAAGTATGFYLLFSVALNVDLPRGVLGF